MINQNSFWRHQCHKTKNKPRRAQRFDDGTEFTIDAIRLARVEIWITDSVPSDYGWGEIKPFLLVRLTTSDGAIGWGETFVLPCREKAVAEIIHALGRATLEWGGITPFTFRELVYRIADKHRGLDYMTATRPCWFEELADGEDIQALAEIRRTSGLKIMMGEKQYGVTHFKPVLAAGAVDILNQDIAGTLDMLEIAARIIKVFQYHLTA